MSPVELILIILVVILAVTALFLWSRSRRSADLKSQFGPEYSRTVHAMGDERKAEAALEKRQKRVASYSIKELPEEMRQHFVETWRKVQAQFVDDPKYAVTRADDLLGEVMTARGYPIKDFEERAEDLSVDHPEVIQNYRAGHDIAIRHSRGEASTEDLRNAMIHYRDLFVDLVDKTDSAAVPRHDPVKEQSVD
jgi:hypothetical protein